MAKYRFKPHGCQKRLLYQRWYKILNLQKISDLVVNTVVTLEIIQNLWYFCGGGSSVKLFNLGIGDCYTFDIIILF